MSVQLTPAVVMAPISLQFTPAADIASISFQFTPFYTGHIIKYKATIGDVSQETSVKIV
jgi:hypothetical protein